jgi:hypothetical protein
MSDAGSRSPMALPPWRYTGAPVFDAGPFSADLDNVTEAAEDLPWPASAYKRPIVCARNAMLASAFPGQSLAGIPDAARGQRRFQSGTGFSWLYTLWEPEQWWGRAGTPVTTPRLVLLAGIADATADSDSYRWVYEAGVPDAGAPHQLTIDEIDLLHEDYFLPRGLSVFCGGGVAKRLLTGMPLSGSVYDEEYDGPDFLDSAEYNVADPARFVGGELLVVTFAPSQYQLGYVNYPLFPVATSPNLPFHTVSFGPTFDFFGVPSHFVRSVATHETTRENPNNAAGQLKFSRYRHLVLWDSHFDTLVTPRNDGMTAFPTQFKAHPPSDFDDYKAHIFGGLDNFTVESFDSRNPSATAARVAAEIEDFWPIP